MKIVVVIGHQRKGSFNHAIVDVAIEQLQSVSHEVIFHDIYDENFDPVLHEAEIPNDAPLPDDIARQCEEIRTADGYIVIHPNWWGQPPAMLKGWIDRVFRQGVVYEFGERGVVGHLAGKTAVVFTTSNTPRDVEQSVFGNPLENLWKTCIFGFCGVTDFTRRNFESMVMSTQEMRVQWLEEVRQIVAERFPAAG